ncbi:tRNA pseudouridine synthase [Sistotremastrum niveocremeum HHB9708]|uniref:tRNA pseudouridine synthase n=1 Tax=Sistotremastrum niveocremeum HHB9708 TaxID=1314777 RepID=A0A164WV94_9AGAM|nr:tRNA pseudouridine synthase [Sistotremastrum niveocremeum HHB9708]
MAATPPAYHDWSREDLINRILVLEGRARPTPPSPALKKPPKRPVKAFDFSMQPRRKIALKFCYAGEHYNGLAIQSDPTPLPTVEAVIFDALSETRLVDRGAGMDGCGWSRCGRTDRGVSAAGQVISLHVRSALGPPRKIVKSEPTPELDLSLLGDDIDPSNEIPPPPQVEDPPSPHFITPATSPDLPSRPELNYVDMLNRVLPSTIRILAWSPVSDSFDARFSCAFRHYKYFFVPSGLDIDAMRDATQRLLGEHDFRNLCKLDPSKQITNFRRVISRAEISSVSSDMMVFDLIGTAFLYNQVRHIMAVLFLIGGGLESPSVMSSLLNADPSHPISALKTDEAIEIVATKPVYQMADGLPLVLWDCGYRPEDVDWQTPLSSAEPRSDTEGLLLPTILLQHLESTRQRSLIKSTLDEYFLKAALSYHPGSVTLARGSAAVHNGQVLNIPIGGGEYRRTGAYVPLLKRERNEPIEETNERWRLAKLRKTQAKAGAEDAVEEE